MSRTKESLKNIVVGFSSQIITTLFQFAVRTIFVQKLSQDYLGINSVFLNILHFLNIAELGFGTAISVYLYKCLAERDKDKLLTYLNAFKKIYLFVGLAILLMGLCILPFISNFLSGVAIKENIYVLFLLYLLDSVSSYWFLSYRSVLLIADQKKYVFTFFSTISSLFISCFQILILFLNGNFYLYLLISVLFHILFNLFLGVFTGKKYPFIKTKLCSSLTKDELKKIKVDVFSILIYKLSTTFNTSADSILISIFVSTIISGFYSNYLLVVNAVSTVVFLVINSLTASVGNLNIMTSSKDKEKVFYFIDYFNFFFYSYCSICLIILLNPFISLWLGDGYLLTKDVVIAIVLNFFFEGALQPSYVFRNACGLFKDGYLRPVFSLLLNIFFSIILGIFFGISGILFATIISRMLSASWFEPFLIFKKVFSKKVWKYYLTRAYYIFVFFIGLIVSRFTYSFFDFNTYWSLVIFSIFSLFVFTTIVCLCTCFLPQFKDSIKRIKALLFIHGRN